MRKQKEEAERYGHLQSQFASLQQRLYLVRLFSIEKGVAALLARAVDANRALKADTIRHAELEDGIKSIEKDKSRVARKVAYTSAPHGLFSLRLACSLSRGGPSEPAPLVLKAAC